jgi:ribosomal protein S18 acetylase RimI-like enzyme
VSRRFRDPTQVEVSKSLTVGPPKDLIVRRVVPPSRLDHAAVRYEVNMSEQIVIRPARDADAAFVGELAQSLLEYGSPIWDEPEALVPGFREALADAVRSEDPRAAVLIAQSSDGTCLGFISLKLREDVAGFERAHVADLAVIEDARMKGIGQALMQAGEAWARERGMPVLSLDVWSTNERALAFYRHLGYRAESLCLIKALD